MEKLKSGGAPRRPSEEELRVARSSPRPRSEARRIRSLSSRSEFLRLKAQGQIFHVNSWLLVNWEKTQSESVRCGWTIPRQIGPAVLRNRFRRWGREYLRRWTADNKLSLDMNLIFKRKEPGFYKSVSHKDFDGAMDKLVAKLQRDSK